jgi:hypothetical protein
LPEWAITRGVFGVPTLIIGAETFWGLDAMDMALDYLGNPIYSKIPRCGSARKTHLTC